MGEIKAKELLLHGDCLTELKRLEDNSVDSVVTDPPYGLSKEPDINEVLTKWLAGEQYDHGHGGFMAKSWDSFVPHPDIWREVFRVLKPGGHALVFAGSRTQDLMTISLRLAGFEVRDVIEWLYFSGFPKSHDVSRAFDRRGNYELSEEYFGWGTSTKPSHEPVIVVTKPKTVEDILDEKLKEVANCLSLFVKIAAQNSTLSLQDYVEELDFARNRVEPKSSSQDVLSGVMDTLRLKTITENINWNTALLCLITLGDRLRNGNTSTTEIVLNTIIELKTLRYFQSLTTLESIIKDATCRSGERMNAETAAGLLNEDLSRLSGILTPPVLENATSKQEEKDSYHRHEPIIVVRKPLIDADTGRKLTVADCVEKYGTGAINIDASRIDGEPVKIGMSLAHRGNNYGRGTGGRGTSEEYVNDEGRFPANCITLDSDEFYSKYFNVSPQEVTKKASKKDRNSDWRGEEITLDEVEKKTLGDYAKPSEGRTASKSGSAQRNHHPTVKPTDLMAWLVRLVTPAGGTVLDPFAGSGSTLVAAKREGFGFVGVELTEEYIPIIEARTGAKAAGIKAEGRSNA